MKQQRPAVLAWCFPIVLLALAAPPVSLYAWPIGPFPAERIDQQVPANNGYVVDKDYFIEYTDNKLRIHSEIQFTLTEGVSEEELVTLKSVWEMGIENLWNSKYEILKDNEYVIPILIDVTFDGPTFNHTVTVKPGAGRANEHEWYVSDSGLVAAHEFGHMLGLFDEYVGGATDPAGEIIDATSIMGSVEEGARPYARHYEGFRAWLASKDPSQTFVLREIPEPSTMLLIWLWVAAAAVKRRAA